MAEQAIEEARPVEVSEISLAEAKATLDRFYNPTDKIISSQKMMQLLSTVKTSSDFKTVAEGLNPRELFYLARKSRFLGDNLTKIVRRALAKHVIPYGAKKGDRLRVSDNYEIFLNDRLVGVVKPKEEVLQQAYKTIAPTKHVEAMPVEKVIQQPVKEKQAYNLCDTEEDFKIIGVYSDPKIKAENEKREAMLAMQAKLAEQTAAKQTESVEQIKPVKQSYKKLEPAEDEERYSLIDRIKDFFSDNITGLRRAAAVTACGLALIIGCGTFNKLQMNDASAAAPLEQIVSSQSNSMPTSMYETNQLDFTYADVQQRIEDVRQRALSRAHNNDARDAINTLFDNLPNNFPEIYSAIESNWDSMRQSGYSKEYSLLIEIVRQTIESGGDVSSLSPMGAMGLGQVVDCVANFFPEIIGTNSDAYAKKVLYSEMKSAMKKYPASTWLKNDVGQKVIDRTAAKIAVHYNLDPNKVNEWFAEKLPLFDAEKNVETSLKHFYSGFLWMSPKENTRWAALGDALAMYNSDIKSFARKYIEFGGGYDEILKKNPHEFSRETRSYVRAIRNELNALEPFKKDIFQIAQDLYALSKNASSDAAQYRNDRAIARDFNTEGFQREYEGLVRIAQMEDMQKSTRDM